MEWLKGASGADITHVPFNGSPPILTAMKSGQVHLTLLTTGTLKPHIDSGDLKPLLTRGSDKRNPAFPDVPTFAEAGVPGYDVTGWYGLCTQSKVPQPVLAKLHADGAKVLSGLLKKRLEDQGITVEQATPEQFATHVKTEIAKWTKVVIDSKLEGD